MKYYKMYNWLIENRLRVRYYFEVIILFTMVWLVGTAVALFMVAVEWCTLGATLFSLCTVVCVAFLIERSGYYLYKWYLNMDNSDIKRKWREFNET